jgi:type IV secretory pathway VirB10-like protein
MAFTLRRQTASLVFLTAAAALPLLVSMAACGGDKQPPVTPPPPPATDTGASTAPTASAPAAPTDTGSATAATPPPPPPAPTSTVATTKSDATWAGCHQSYQAKLKDVSKDVAAMAGGCKTATKLKLSGKTLTGKQADQDAPQSFPLDAKANHCYRVYAQASDDIKDLDIVVKDSAGVIVGQDSTDDPSPVVMEDGAICFSKDDKASVVVAVGMGKGNYAVQIWSD